MDQTHDFSRRILPAPRGPRVARRGISVNVRGLHEIDEAFIQSWNDLESHANHRNPFLSPAYVLPAAKHLPMVASPLIITMERQGELLGLGVFEDLRRSRRLPVRHLHAWQTPHTYLDGFLLRHGSSHAALEEFWHFMVAGEHDWHGVDFPRVPLQEPFTSTLDASASEMSIDCIEGTRWGRASLQLQNFHSGQILQSLSTKRAKSLRRGWRELEKHGTPRYELTRTPELMSSCSEELMALEHLGWKSETGTSLISNQQHARFFRDMTDGMAERGNLSFSRILVADQAVASVVHLHAGDTVYAFKLGWNPAFERGCPGFHLKLGTATHAESQLQGVNLIDSCSQPGSFIENVWPHRREFCSRTYVTSPVGTLAATMVRSLRWVRKSALAVSKGLFFTEQNKEPK